jgi:pimeloyl-ACP methyl ester carboxylesterase
MRFAANGYPADRIIAYDHDGAGMATNLYADGVDATVDAALAEFGVQQVYLVGHSRGTMVSSNYLGDPTRAAKVAKYIAIDGAPCPTASGVPCVAPTQTLFPGQEHVNVCTSAESFAMQYEFLVGEPPQVVDIVRQKGPVTIAGKAVHFPANIGRDGATLEIWEIDPDTGYRDADEPVATFPIGPTGEWGPATVSADKRYEMALTHPDYGTHHLYPQRFLRDTHLVRLLSGDPETSTTRQNTNMGPNHAAVVAIRMREWYAENDPDLPDEDADILEVSVASESGDQEPVNVLLPYVTNGNIALHLHDDTVTPQETTLAEIAYFSGQPFQSGIDIYLPASDPPDGTITFKNIPRGDTSRPQVTNLPNWSSENNFITVMFADFAVD